jgi:hypothetical protein
MLVRAGPPSHSAEARNASRAHAARLILSCAPSESRDTTRATEAAYYPRHTRPGMSQAGMVSRDSIGSRALQYPERIARSSNSPRERAPTPAHSWNWRKSDLESK